MIDEALKAALEAVQLWRQTAAVVDRLRPS